MVGSLLKCSVYYMITGVFCFLIGRFLPKKMLKTESFPFRSFSFEKDGKVYEKLMIKKWQKKVPDMSKIFSGIMPVKKISSQPDHASVELMIKETCVAEIAHLALFVTGLGCFRFFTAKVSAVIYLIYFLANLPYVLIQRYNRPRLKKLYAACLKREEALCCHDALNDTYSANDCIR